MKKIMFNDRYGLTQSVLEGRKTMTRRIVSEGIIRMARLEVSIHGGDIEERIQDHTPLRYLDNVAIAQPYKDIFLTDPTIFVWKRNEAGWTNKMFIRAEYMPHRIRITDIKVERLQDISEEEAMREGVFKYDQPPLHHEYDLFAPWPPYVRPYKNDNDNLIYRCTARYAFAYLIDKVSGKGTWERNPWVFAYTFELL